eukprot:292384_1
MPAPNQIPNNDGPNHSPSIYPSFGPIPLNDNTLLSKYVEQYGTNPSSPEPRRIRTNYKQRMDTVKHGMDEIIYRAGWIQILLDESRRDRIGRAMCMIQEQRCVVSGNAEYLVELSHARNSGSICGSWLHF